MLVHHFKNCGEIAEPVGGLKEEEDSVGGQSDSGLDQRGIDLEESGVVGGSLHGPNQLPEDPGIHRRVGTNETRKKLFHRLSRCGRG